MTGERCKACGNRAGARCTDCEGFRTYGRIIEGLCAPCRGGGLRMFGTRTLLTNQGPWKHRAASGKGGA